MAKAYEHQVTVRVWRNLKTLGFVPTAHFGHSTVTLTSNDLSAVSNSLDRRGRARTHISFWPERPIAMVEGILKVDSRTNNRTKKDKQGEMSDRTEVRLEVGYRLKHGIPVSAELMQELGTDEPLMEARATQERREEGGRRRGVVIWLQSPQVKVELPGMKNDDVHWGLSIRRMDQWWRQFLNSHPHYKALSFQNCSGVALMALRQGGSEAFEPLPHVHIYAEPLQVERYARKVADQMKAMEASALELDADIRRALATGQLTPAMISGKTADGLWDLETWKRNSALGTFQMRSPTIREIDAALAAFHANTWNSGFNDRYCALAKLFRAVAKHRHDKAQSGRSAAVLALGVQILALLRNPGGYQ